MKKAKEEIIADLYSLRAGLSVISEKADEVRELEQKVKDIELDMEDRASLTRQGEKLEEDIEQKIFTVKGKIKQIDNILAKPYSKQENLRRLKELQNKVVDSASKGMSQAEIEALSRDVEIAEDSLNIKTIHVSRKYADFDIKTFLMWFFIWGPIATCIVNSY